MKDIIIMISGRGSNMAAILAEIDAGVLKGLCRVKAVFSNDETAPGLKIAASCRIRTSVIRSQGRKRKEYNKMLLDWLLEENPDYIILAGYMLILPPEIINAFPQRIINIHPADTTQHQGLHGYEWAWDNHLTETKITVHYVDEGLDTGSIISQQVVNLQGTKSLDDIEKRGLQTEHKMYSTVLAQLLSHDSQLTTHDSQLTTHEIAIIDFGGQYTHLIARRIRKLGVFSEIYQPEDFRISPQTIGIIFSGGPQSVIADSAYKIDIDLNAIKIPVLGICYGHQLIASLTGGTIESGNNPEYGYAEIDCQLENTLFSGTVIHQKVWMSHGDQVTGIPAGFKITAFTDTVPIAAYESFDGRIMGVQFHPEVVHTQYGNQLLDNFLNRCTTSRDWLVENYKDQLIASVRQQAGDKDVLILLSGGVDSLVAMELCLAALGSHRVHAIHIDTGFMRQNESLNIIEHLESLGYKQMRLINAEELYLKELAGVVDPETKRLIIGRLFVEIASEAIAEFENKDILLVQGTIYPDTIESGASQKSAKIKTHHNRVDEIEKLIAAGKILEPIKDLYKDEVRELGIELDIPPQLVNRHPFPGPGLAIRILGSETSIPEPGFDSEEELLNNIIKEYGLKGIILPIKSVGVMGDFRTYQHPALIWFKSGYLTSPVSRLPSPDSPWNSLQKASIKIVNTLKTVNRVVFSLNEPEKYILKEHYLTKEACNNLRRVDFLLMNDTAHIKEIWQMPVVQLPLFDLDGDQVYLMRPVTSLDAMTANFYEMDFDLLNNLIAKTKQLSGIANVLYDITSKPPATIEWE
ncbi:MAG: glutamine-hydrolyzing GMP synthase [Candidatus Cloacimonetes bacterium]|nr:glutamine-hydrolyzing GMP synthase [Candidatus Cloacimonadota bacterium]